MELLICFVTGVITGCFLGYLLGRGDDILEEEEEDRENHRR